MFGCEVIFASDNEPITVVGCIFNDGSIYLHEPICDMWASIPDLIAERQDITGFQVIGPVIPVEQVRAAIEDNHKKSVSFMRKQIAANEQMYKRSLEDLTHFDEYTQKPINFTSKLEDVA